MKIFLDTADIEDIERANKTGLIRGITTNPSHIAKTGKSFESVVQKICKIIPDHVSAEAVAESADDLVVEAERIASIAPQIVVKIPMTREGLIAVKRLSEKGIKTNVTMVFSPTQAFLAMSAGASFVSIVLSRLEKVGTETDRFIEDTMQIRNIYGFQSKILAASIKTQPTLLNCLRKGVDISTIPTDLFDQLYVHPLTDEGLEQFTRDWEKVVSEA